MKLKNLFLALTAVLALASCKSHYEIALRSGRKEAVFRIFDKKGKTRSKLNLDEEQLEGMRRIIDRILNGENEEE